MLSIAIYNNKLNYIRTKRSRTNLLITHYGINRYDNLNHIIKSSFKDILTKENKINDKDISCVIDSQFCSFNEVFFENESSLEFHNNLSGNSNLSDYIDSYYFPIGLRDDHYLGIHVDKSIKQRILNAVEDNNCSLSFLGIGIFSAEILARYIFQAKTLDSYLVLRFITSNLIEILYINDGLLMLYGQYRISNGSVKPIKSIGSSKDKSKINQCVEKIILKRNKKVSMIQKVFIYQSQGQSALVKDLIKDKSNNYILLNAFNYNNSLGYKATIQNTMNHLSYAELGHIFRGLNV